MTESKSAAGAAKPAKSQIKLNVLIVDPNPDHRDRLKSIVRDVEFVGGVSDRPSPHSILDVLAKNPAHVLMIDVKPGAGNAFDIVRVIRGKDVGARMRFVLIGDKLGEGIRAQGAAAGIAAFLERPYDMKSVEAALRTAAGAVAQENAAQAKALEGLHETLDKLRQVSLFAGFTDQELVRLLKICRTRHYGAGTYVFHEGEPGTSLFVLVAGALQIRTQVDGKERVLVEMAPGDCFGEMAIIDSEPRSADAVAASDCTAIEVNESVVNNNDDMISLKLVRQIAILLAKKLRKQSLPPAP